MRDFSWPVNTYNENEYIEFKSKIESHKDTIKDRNIYIFGGGIRGCEFLAFCERLEINVRGIVDNDETKNGGTLFSRYVIHGFDQTHQNDPEGYYIISVENAEAIIRQLDGEGLKEDSDYFAVEPVLYGRFINEFFNPTGSLLIMGDCIFSTVGVADTDKKSLGDIIEEEMKGRDIKLLQVHGMGNRTFYHLLDLQLKLHMPIKRVLLAVNTVMFSGKKYLLPRAQHTPLLSRIDQMLPFKDNEYSEYVKLTAERMSRFNTDAFVSSPDTARSHNEEHIVRLRMKQNYMYELDTGNESMEYLVKIRDLCLQSGIKLYMFFPPINYEHGNEIFGDAFENICRRNLKRITDYLLSSGDENLRIIDMSFDLESSMFAAVDTINELTNYEGRIKEANRIKDSLRHEC